MSWPTGAAVHWATSPWKGINLYLLFFVGMGCFWGAERKFWILKGVYSTQVGFAGGFTPNPTYKEVCSGRRAVLWVTRRDRLVPASA